MKKPVLFKIDRHLVILEISFLFKDSIWKRVSITVSSEITGSASESPIVVPYNNPHFIWFLSQIFYIWNGSLLKFLIGINKLVQIRHDNQINLCKKPLLNKW